MKQLLLLLAACVVVITGYAQQEKNELQKFRENTAAIKNLKSNSRTVLRTDTAKEFFNRLLYLKNPRLGVHRLPPDNMPCIVPDPGASVAITNLWKGDVTVPFRSRTQPIPNPARPLIIKP